MPKKIVAQNKGSMPAIVSWGVKRSTRYSRNILITIVKSPSVRKMMGKLISFSIGFRKKFASVSKAATHRRETQSPENENPEINRGAANIAIALANI